MPAGSRFTVPVPLKQFFASFPLRIFGVENLEPSALFALRDIWAKPWQRCPPSPIRRLAEITLCQNAPHAPHIALETGEVCNSRRRSSCLRSSNRSVRHQKSTDQMRKSTAGFTAEHQF